MRGRLSLISKPKRVRDKYHEKTNIHAATNFQNRNAREDSANNHELSGPSTFDIWADAYHLGETIHWVNLPGLAGRPQKIVRLRDRSRWQPRPAIGKRPFVAQF